MHFLESPDKEKEVAFKNLSSNFVIPFDIKNDIVYCQKSFRTYLKVYQMVIAHYGDRIPTIPKIKKLMSDLEREIYQINAEQKFLLLRLRRSFEEFYNSYNQLNIPIHPDHGMDYINEIFKNSMDNLLIDCTLLPINVKKRRSLEHWIYKFGLNKPDNRKQLPKSQPSSTSMLSSNLQTLPAPLSTPYHSQGTQQQMETVETLQLGEKEIMKIPSQSIDMESLKWPHNIPENLILKQVSLLKPKSERSIGNDNDNDNERNENLDKINNIKTEPSIEETVTVENKIEQTQAVQSTVPPKVSMSINTGRMNLLQALNKAKSQSQQIMATAAPSATSTIPNSKNNLLKFKKIPLIVSGSRKSKDYYQNCKPSTSKTKPKSNDNSVPQSSTASEDSSDGLKNLPPLEDELPEPVVYNQEMFLRLFGLNTIAHSIYLQQRRSKRRRRNVQNNERKDFHYGNLEISENMAANKEKKKKIFLASPTVNRNMKRKQLEKSYKDKGRSSSSPEQKILCNQCSKNGDIGLSHCQTCRGYFHVKCHRGSFLKKPLHLREKICPTCYKLQKSRSNSTDEQSRSSNNSSPNSQISLLKELHGKLSTARSRKNSLLKESEVFKTKMNELFTIVSTIKKEDTEEDNNTDLSAHKLKCEETLMDTLKCDEMINDDDSEKRSSSNKVYSEEESKFDKIMMLIHDNADNIRKNSNHDDDDDDEEKSENIYEICNSDLTNDDSNDDLYMIIDPNDDEEDGNESIYEIQENSSDSADLQIIEE